MKCRQCGRCCGRFMVNTANDVDVIDEVSLACLVDGCSGQFSGRTAPDVSGEVDVTSAVDVVDVEEQM